MGNQVNISDQNTQQIGQKINNQSVQIPEKSKANYWKISTIILFVFLVLESLVYFLSISTQKRKMSNNDPLPTSIVEVLQATETITPIQSQEIIFSFVRNGSVYLYDNGAEKLLVSPTQKTTQNVCYNIVYPFISPDKKYVAYIEQNGDAPGYGGCLGGILRIVYLDTGKIKTTNYKTSYLKWNSSNQIVFSPEQEKREGPQTYTVKEVFYDPANGKETIFNTVIDQDRSTYADTMVSGEFPFDTNKLIKYKDSKYYLVDKSGNKETFILDKSQVERFLDWSPNGRYAIFESYKKSAQDFVAIELVVDTQNPIAQAKEIGVGRGGAGGDFSTGRKWYFEKGFVAYCRQDLYFVDGSKPLQLTSDGGGGCHNEEGFVATSPDGNFAFVKYKDRFELHSKTGEIKKISEVTPLAKGRGTPKNLIWINNGNMLIFQSTNGGGNSYPEPPRIYLFERKSNTIKPILENGYLVESFY